MDRNGILVKRCFNRYLLPMLLLNLGISLSEFVDSIIVSKLLGENGLVVVNAAMPISLSFSFIALLFGVGGSVLYANFLGERKNDEADSVYTSAVTAAVGIAVLIAVIVFIFSGSFADILVDDAAILKDMQEYIRTCALFGIPYIFITCISNFIISAGNPNISSFLIIEANIVNLIMDIVFIRFVGLGVSGAAYGTLTGYLSAIICLFFLRRKTGLRFRRCKAAYKHLLSSIITGAPSGVGQLGLAAKISVMNLLAIQYAGLDGQIIVALCIQTLSIVSLVISGVLNSFLPIIATLNGEEDIAGIRFSAIHAYKVMISVIFIIVMIFELFPGLIGSIYNVTSETAIAMEQVDFRIFSISHLFRASVLFLMYYYSSRAFKKLSISMTLFDSFLVIPLAYIMCNIFGITGLWTAFIVSSLISLIWAFAASRHIEKRSEPDIHGILVLPKASSAEKVFDVTIQDSNDKAVYMSEEVMNFLSSCGCDKKKSMFGSVIAEEMAVFTRKQMEEDGYLDIRIKSDNNRICMYFRSDGQPMSALNAYTESDNAEPDHLDMIYKMAESVQYSRLLGMNSTKIVL